MVHGMLSAARSFITSCTPCAKHLDEKSCLCLPQCHQENLVVSLPPHPCQSLHGQHRVLNKNCTKKALESKARWHQTKYISIRCTWRLQVTRRILFHSKLKFTCASRPLHPRESKSRHQYHRDELRRRPTPSSISWVSMLSMPQESSRQINVHMWLQGSNHTSN